MIDEFVTLSYPVYLYPVEGDSPTSERAEYLPTDEIAARVAGEWRAELRLAGKARTADGLDRVVRGEPCPTRLGVPLTYMPDVRAFWRMREMRKAREADEELGERLRRDAIASRAVAAAEDLARATAGMARAALRTAGLQR